MKALHLQMGQDAWEHSVARLLRQLPGGVEVLGELIEVANDLDAFYLPARYPNSFAEGAPFEHYGEKQSREAISYAHQIVEFTRAEMARCRDRLAGGEGLD